MVLGGVQQKVVAHWARKILGEEAISAVLMDESCDDVETGAGGANGQV